MTDTKKLREFWMSEKSYKLDPDEVKGLSFRWPDYEKQFLVREVIEGEQSYISRLENRVLDLESETSLANTNAKLYKSLCEELAAALMSRPTLTGIEFEKLRMVSAWVHEYDSWQVDTNEALDRYLKAIE